MLTIAGIFISLFLIILILIRIPSQDVGLSSFANNSNLLGSPGAAQRFFGRFNRYVNYNIFFNCF